MVGQFVLDGNYDVSGNVTIIKKYLQAHSVTYKGVYKNNLINGQWFIYEIGNSGAFQLGWYTDTP